MPHLLTLLLPLFPCFALRVMASSGIYKLDEGKPYLNNCFPAKNLLRKPEEGQVTSPICYLCLTASSCFRMSLMSISFSPAPRLLFPAPPIPIPSSPSSPAASGSLLKCMSYHRVPFCSVTSHCWLLHLLFCLQSLTSHYPLCSPIPLFMPSSIVLSFHIVVYICPECSSPHSSYPYSSHPPSPALLPHAAPTVPTLSGEPSSSFCFLFNDELYSAKLLSKMA